MKKIIALLLLIPSAPTLARVQQWNGSYYTQNSHHQFQTATSYLQYIDLHKYPAILDIGCGSGDITAYIAQRAQESSVIGIDLSTNMIQAAKEQYAATANLSFRVADAQDFSLNAQFNLIVSSNTFHWIKNQQKALHCVARHLAPHGELHILMSSRPTDLVHAFEITAQRKKWQHLFVNHKPIIAYFQTEPGLRLLAEKAGLKVVTTQTIPKERIFKDRESIESWILGFMGGIPQIGQLPKEELLAFTSDFLDDYIHTVGHTQDGSIAYRIPLIHFHAIKE